MSNATLNRAGPAGQGMGESASFGVASQQCEREKPQEDSTTTSEGSEPPPKPLVA